MLIRIESDEDITKLLKKHKKYKDEYLLNVINQGYISHIFEKYSQVMFTVAIAEMGLQVMSRGLKQAGLLGDTKHLNK
jgi:hypothetical protein